MFGGSFLLKEIVIKYTREDQSLEGNSIQIPKGNIFQKYIRNMRPISLLNVHKCILKLASAAIANRIKYMLPCIINEVQIGFVPGHFIGKNIRFIIDLLQYTEFKNKKARFRKIF